MKTEVLTRDRVLEELRIHREELEGFGVKRIGLFGSFARNEQNKKSDIDLVAEFDESFSAKDFKGLFDAYIELSSYLESLFGRKVDILTPISIETIRIRKVAEEIKRSLIYV